MSKVLIIGAGGVGSVVAHKCAEASKTFNEIVLASRTQRKCDEIKSQIEKRYNKTIKTAQVDA
ncbi:MAG: saccharopine dehydrogenase NADP-binding domain-containing protein, partial [Nanoarchaeota archaeon]